MSIVVEAVYENGVLRPATPLKLQEQEKVRITIEPQTSWVHDTFGIIGWKGDAETLRRIAEDPELSVFESP